MCTAATYQTRDFYMGRTLDYEFSYGEEIVITPRRFPIALRHGGVMDTHYAIIGRISRSLSSFPGCWAAARRSRRPVRPCAR